MTPRHTFPIYYCDIEESRNHSLIFFGDGTALLSCCLSLGVFNILYAIFAHFLLGRGAPGMIAPSISLVPFHGQSLHSLHAFAFERHRIDHQHNPYGS